MLPPATPGTVRKHTHACAHTHTDTCTAAKHIIYDVISKISLQDGDIEKPFPPESLVYDVMVFYFILSSAACDGLQSVQGIFLSLAQ